jgi:hypothetical protein
MSSRPHTTFDTPQFDLIPDTHVRQYANVDNRLLVCAQDLTERLVPIVVPTMLFTLMRNVFKIDPVDMVRMYLATDEAHYAFGIAWGDRDTDVADLWAYTRNALPPFLR